MWIDTHAHLVSEAFDADRDDVIERAARAGVARIVCIGDSLDASRQAVALAHAWDGVYATAGIHPHQAAQAPSDFEGELKALLQQEKVVAIGETGLDYHYDFSPRETQQNVFRRHIRLAVDMGLPLVVHNREADDDLLQILKEEGAERASGVLHCFWSDSEAARKALDMGFYLGVGGPVTFKNTGDLREVLKAIPLDRLIVETDAPYLAPVPYRGKRNEPAYVVETGKMLAELKGLGLEDLADVTKENAQRLFKIA